MVDCARILPNLFLGSKLVPYDYLVKQNITHCVCVAPDNEVPDMLNMEFYRFPVSFQNPDEQSRENMYKARDKCIELMEQGYKVFLHCVAGFNRSPAVAAMVISKLYDVSIDEAVMHIECHRLVAPEKHLALL
jgi:protein-tyrosine phosphatase